MSGPTPAHPTGSSAALLQRILEASPRGIIAVNTAGVVELWGPGAERIFGMRDIEAAGKPLPVRFDWSQGDHGEARVQFRRADGSLVIIDAEASPWHDAEGKLRGTLIRVADLNARRAAEQAIRDLMMQREEAHTQARAERRFRELLDAAPDAIIEIDQAGTIVLLNQSTERLFGYSRAELLGRSVDLLVPAEMRHRHAGHRSHFWSHPSTRSMGTGLTLEGQHKDGTHIPVEISLSPVRSEDGFRVTAIIRDVSERRQSEEAFRAIQEQRTAELRRFRELLEAAPDAIIEIDQSGAIVLMNQSTERLFGYSRSELLGQSVDILVPAEMRPGHAGHRAHFWSHPSTRPMGTDLALEGQHKDGTKIPVEISLSPVRFEEGFRVTAIIRDVSDRRRAQREFRAAQEQHHAELRDKNRELEARNLQVEAADHLKNEFLSGMSHELRTPLHTIIGYSDLLLEEMEGPLNAKQKRFMGHIHADSMHLLALINDILDLSKIEAGRLELHCVRFPLMGAVQEVLGSLRPQSSAKNQELLAEGPKSAQVHADRTRFKQILANLLSNAVKFTPAGGRIVLEVRTLDDGFEIAVSDTGPGIPRELHEAVFDKFYQISRKVRGAHEGTGLGLAITKRLVEQHGGTIRLESDPGHGCTFTFTIPHPTPSGN